MTHDPAPRDARVIGLLGGTFDPVHVAHLAMAEAFATALDLDELRFLPASRSWQKDASHATGAERLAMLRAAVAPLRAGRTRFVVDPRELERPGKTYTIDTLRELRAEVGPSVPLVFLIGADQLEHLDTWKDWTALWDHAHLAAVSRPGFSLTHVPPAVAKAWTARGASAEELRRRASGSSFLLSGLALDVSATAIRAALAQRHDKHDGEHDSETAARLASMVPQGVLDYIELHRLYKN